MSRLQKRYKEEVKKTLQERFKYENEMLIPSLRKIVISMGLAEATKDKNALQDCVKEMTSLSGQKPIITKARTSVANFKLREGQAIGLKVTLRKKRMYDFFDRFCHIVSPRIRDFRGFPIKCDGSGNYSLGLEEQQIFPEINIDSVKRTQGMNITFVTSATNDEECAELLKQLGLPFKTENNS
ncbi:MAG: 50S ribosomal protein L5 [Rhabdochlamydiaceae bacterium]|jgi:large subunit ribosomal protein L5